MDLQILIIAFLLIVIVIIISDTPATAMITVSLMANLIVLYLGMNKIKANKKKQLADTVGAPPSSTDAAPGLDSTQAVAAPASDPQVIPADSDMFYGPDYQLHRNFDAPYTPHVYTCGDAAVSVDNAAVELARRRFREKRAMTAATNKNANYYKYHFGEELSEAESRQWWGEDDY